MTRRLILLVALVACGSSDEKQAAPPDPVKACEQWSARLQTCQDAIVTAVGARMPGADLVSLRKKLTAPPNCARATADKQSPLVKCGSDDCEAMASCMAELLAPKSPDAGPTLTAKAGAFDGNVLFVLVDTVRADRLGVAGYERDGKSVTPRIDAFAASAVRFTNVYAQGANTPRSLPSIFASRYPHQVPFARDFHNFAPLKPEANLLFETLSAAGMKTTGFSSHFYFAPRRNVTQGFAEYDNEGALDVKGSNTDVASPRVVAKAIKRLETLAADGTRFAMFVHLFEPHSTYVEHDEYPTKLKGIAGLAEKYDYEIAVSDRYVGELLDALDRLQLSGRTIVVVMSDHGESFGAHRDVEGNKLFFHGQSLYDEVLRVPLLIRAPGTPAAVRDDVTALIDVGPTLLDLLGLDPPPTFQGRSLVPAMRGSALPPRPVGAVLQAVPAWNHSATAWISADGTEKIIAHGDGKLEVFDLAKDPGELENLAEKDPERTKRLKAELESWQQSLAP
jgi:arylsulfatase A-like enzyme